MGFSNAVFAGGQEIINTTSTVISVTSAKLSAVEAHLQSAINVVSAHVDSVSNNLSNETSARIAADDGLSLRINSAESVIAQQLSAVSAHIDSVSNNLSNETSARIAVDSALADAISVVSAQVASLSVTVSALSTRVDSVSNAVSIVSVAAASKNQKISIANQGSVFVTDPSLINFFGNAVSSFVSGSATKINISVTPGAASVTSAEYTSLVERVSANSAQMTSADNAASVRMDGLSNNISAKNFIINIKNQGTGFVSNTKFIDFFGNAVSSYLSGVITKINISATGGGSASPTSQQFSALSARVESNSALMAFADAALSNSISSLRGNIFLNLQNVDASAVSAGTPVYAFTSANTFKQATASAGATVERQVIGITLDTAIAISATGTVQTEGIVSIPKAAWAQRGGGLTGLQIGSLYYLASTLGNITKTPPAPSDFVRPIGVALTSAAMLLHLAHYDDLGNAVSVISQQVSVLSARVASNSAQMTSADNAISAAQAGTSGAVTLVNQAVSLLSVNVATISLNVSAMSTRLDAVSQAHSALSVRVESNSAQMTSADNAISAAQAATSAAVTSVNQVVSALSVNVATISLNVSAMSTRVDVISQQVSVISAGLGAPQLKVVGTEQSVSGTALVKISGLSVALAANGIYQIDGYLMHAMSAASTFGFAVSNATATFQNATLRWLGNISIVAAGVSGLNSNVAAAGWMNEAGFGSVTYSAITGGTVNLGTQLAGIVAVSTTGGTLQIKAKAGSQGVLTIRKGSFVRAYKIA